MMKLWKRALGLFLLLAVLVLVLPTNADAAEVASGSCGDDLTWVLTDDGTLTISGTGAMTDYYYSSRVPWYNYTSSIKNVVIKKGVTSIGDYAFYDCTSLTSIEIPDSVTSIGAAAFFACDSLTSIEIPDSVTSIDECTFNACTRLTGIEIPESVTSIGAVAFMNCTSLTSIYFLGDAPEISDDAFSWVTATAYYPAGNETWTQDVMQGYGITWVAYTAAPVVKVTNIASTGKIKVSWNAVEGAEKYMVYRSTSKNSGYSRLITTKNTYVNNTSAEVGKTYYYYVIAVGADGNKSEKSNIAYRCCDLAQPEIKLTNVASSGKIKVSWNKVEGATKYEVYRATSKSGTYKRIITTKNLYVLNKSTDAGKTYYYKVRALCDNSSATSAFSAIGYRCCDLARPVITVTRNSSGNPVIKWDAVDGATKYEVWYATSKNGTYKKLITTTKTKVVNSSAVAGKTYYYKVRAVCGVSAATSAFSAVKYIKAK